MRIIEADGSETWHDHYYHQYIESGRYRRRWLQADGTGIVAVRVSGRYEYFNVRLRSDGAYETDHLPRSEVPLALAGQPHSVYC